MVAVRKYLKRIKEHPVEYFQVKDSNVTDVFGWAEYRLRHRPNKKTLFLEFHPDRLHTRLGLKQYFHHMRRIREVAKELNLHIFSFSLVREPMEFFRSYFAFFHSIRCVEAWCAHPAERFQNLTDENLIKVAKSNHQTTLLAGDFNVGDFEVFLKQLEETFDWIGTTKDLSTKTLPLLSKIMTGTARIPKESVANVAPRDKVPFANETVLSILRDRSKRDQLLYEWVQRTYTLPESIKASSTV